MPTSSRTVFRTAFQPLAEYAIDSAEQTELLVTDIKGSTFNIENPEGPQTHAYTVYGYSSALPMSRTVTGFNSENLETISRCYLLGNGYRAFSPLLMRFLSPDSWSPFSGGGINPYMYCGGDPINYKDESGHFRHFSQWFKKTPATNGKVITALVKALKTSQTISKHLASDNLDIPPSYASIQRDKLSDFTNKWTSKLRESYKANPTVHPIHGSTPPKYTTQPFNQITLSINLGSRDVTSPLSESNFISQRRLLIDKINSVGLDARGLPLKGVNTDAMFEHDALFNQLRLDSLALTIRLRNTGGYVGSI